MHQNTISIKDKNLINKVYLNMNKKMFKFALIKLKSDSDAEDALKETFLKITKYIKKISELDCDIREAYCFKILENEIINIIREREKSSPIEMKKINCLISYEDEYSFEDNSETEDIEKLKIYINELSDDERLKESINKDRISTDVHAMNLVSFIKRDWHYCEIGAWAYL